MGCPGDDYGETDPSQGHRSSFLKLVALATEGSTF